MKALYLLKFNIMYVLNVILDDVHGIPARGSRRELQGHGSSERQRNPERLRDNGRHYAWNETFQNIENYGNKY